jgi:hypothetical protein
MATVRRPARPGHGFPAWVVEAWQTAVLRVRGFATAGWLWDRVLTPDDRRRLGGDLEAAYARHGGTAGMWMYLRGLSYPRAVVAVATRCGLLDPDTVRGLLRAFREEPVDPAEAVEWAAAGGGLVLVETPRRAHWEGEPIPVDWARYTAPWVLLWELAQTAKAGGVVDAVTLRDGAGGDPKFVTKLKYRLVNAAGFPLTLADRVVPAGRGTYRLDLPAARVRVFERGPEEAVREWTP